MIRQSILAVLLISYTVCGVISGEDRMEEKIEETKRYYVATEEYCSMEDLGEMDYYLFCHTEMSTDVGPVEFASVLINDRTQTVDGAKELYQDFKERLSLEEEEDEGEGGKTEIFYISPDCKWVVTQKWSEHQTINTQMLFYEKEKVKEKETETREGVYPILIVKDEETYQEMEEGQYNKLLELKKKIGYGKMNAQGDMYAGTNIEDSLLIIGTIKDGTEQWRYDLAEIKKKAREIRKNRGYEENSGLGVWIEQFEGNEEEGWMVVQAGPSSFFRIAYPSGEVIYLGEYLYSPCFSPDGKYLAYSGVDYSNVVGMELDEQEQLPLQGVYIKEMEIGRAHV